jgi:hypothetical protein
MERQAPVMLAVKGMKGDDHTATHIAVEYNDSTGFAKMRCGWEGFVSGFYLAPTLRQGVALLGHDLCTSCERAMEKEKSVFELEDMFFITGRGTCVTGWVTGLVHAGDTMTSGEQTTQIRGVERHPTMNADTRIDRRTVGLLVEGALEDYAPGTRWVIEPKESE